MLNDNVESQSLYDRIGGEPVIKLLVSKFYQRILEDPDLAPFFKHSSMDRLRHMQTEYFRAALDGPPSYAGLPIAKAHQGRGIKRRHFNLFAQHVLEALTELRINAADIDEVISRINLLADEVASDPGMPE